MPPAITGKPFTLISTNLIPPKTASYPHEALSAPHIAFARCFVWDLNVFPVTNDKDAEAIESLTSALKASSMRSWSRTKFPKLVKFFESGSEYPGRRVCAVHKNINPTVLFNLMDIIRDETALPEIQFCAQRLSNMYLRALRDINLVWDKEYYKRYNIEIERVPGQLLPDGGHELFQESNCAGCCLRRILSDHQLVSALLAEVRFSTLRQGVEKEVIDYLEAVWYVLGERRPDLWDTQGKVILARHKIEADVEMLWKYSSSFRRENI